MTRILGIDPGNVESAYALIDADTCRPIEVAKERNDLVLELVMDQCLGDPCDDEPVPFVDQIVIEMVAQPHQRRTTTMTDLPTTSGIIDTAGDTETAAAVRVASQAAATHVIDKDAGLFVVAGPNGDRVLLDLADRLRELNSLPPVRKIGAYRVATPDALIDYLAKHATPATELWGSDKAGTIRAVIDAHGDTTPGIEAHTATLALPFTDDWKEWVERDGKLSSQGEFAEFIEDHLTNLVAPSAADMLELAQTFRATTKVDFASSQRLKSGETELQYAETQTASAGKKGSLTIPDTLTLALAVYEGGPQYKVEARFRYRIDGACLLLGVKLTRPADVRRHAFGEVVAQVEAETERTVWPTP